MSGDEFRQGLRLVAEPAETRPCQPDFLTLRKKIRCGRVDNAQRAFQSGGILNDVHLGWLWQADSVPGRSMKTAPHQPLKIQALSARSVLTEQRRTGILHQ